MGIRGATAAFCRIYLQAGCLICTAWDPVRLLRGNRASRLGPCRLADIMGGSGRAVELRQVLLRVLGWDIKICLGLSSSGKRCNVKPIKHMLNSYSLT